MPFNITMGAFTCNQGHLCAWQVLDSLHAWHMAQSIRSMMKTDPISLSGALNLAPSLDQQTAVWSDCGVNAEIHCCALGCLMRVSAGSPLSSGGPRQATGGRPEAAL